MEHYDIVAANCHGIIESLSMTVDALASPLSAAAATITGALLQDGKVIACGIGPDAALAQLFVTNMLGHFQQERPALPAMALGSDGGTLASIASHDGDRDMFARPLQALGQPGDILLCLASGVAGNSLLRAVESARERNMVVVALSNSGDDSLVALLREGDIQLAAQGASPARVLELHAILLQNLCELIDHNLFGGYPGNAV